MSLDQAVTAMAAAASDDVVGLVIRWKMRKLLSALALAALCTGCRDAPPASDTAPPPAATTDRPRYTIDQFRGLHFLVGNWKGTMANGSLFFESYRLLNDSTIQMYAHADSTFGVPKDSS